MRVGRKLGLKWHIDLLDASGTAGYSFGVLQIVFGWCMNGVGLVEGRPTPIPTGEYGAYVYDCGIPQKQLAKVISTRSGAPGGHPPGM